MSRDRSERVDPERAADELIAYAAWVKGHALRESGRRIPKETAEILDPIADKNQGRAVVYRGFRNFKPRRNWVDETKQKMIRELFLNQDEIVEFEQRLRD